MKRRPLLFRPACLTAICSIVMSLSSPGANPIIDGGSPVVTGNGGVIDGNEQTGYFVKSGSLTITNATLQNFTTTGGTGSGGGAGLGGAVFVNSGATVTLNNVNFTGNTVIGGTGGVGTAGGSLNNLFNSSSIGQAASGYTPNGTDFTDIGGTTGTKGMNGAGNATGIGATGGNGGNGGNGGDRSDSLILGVTTASIDLVNVGIEIAAASANPFTANVAIGLAPSVASAGINLGSAVAALVYFDKSLSDGQIGLGGGAGSGGNGGNSGFGYGGGTGGNGGNGGTGGSNWSGSAYSGGAAGGDAGDGGSGGIGGFGAGGGKGGDGGNGGGGAGVAATNGTPAQAAVYETQVIEATYSKGYYDPTTHAWVQIQGNLTSPVTPTFYDHDGQPGTPLVLLESIETSPRTEIQILKTPAREAIAANEGGQRPNGADGSGGAGGKGGFGAGAGSEGDGSSSGDAGTGGNGYGGAIFVRDGGTLIVKGDALFDRNATSGGSSENGGAAGEGVGADLFIMKGSNVILDAGAGHTITFNGGIADDSAASISGASLAAGQGAGLEIRSGRVIFNGENTYTGQTKITGGTLQAQDGYGIHRNSNLNLAGGVLQSNGLFNRYLGTGSDRLQWTGSGGFSAEGGDLTVRVNQGQALTWGGGSFVTDGSSLIFGSDTATDNVTFVNAINLGGGTRSVLAATNAAGSNLATLAGVLSGSGSLVLNDGTHRGTVVLTAANTYSGGTVVRNGTLALQGNGALNANGAVSVESAGHFDISQTGDQSIGTLSGAGTVHLGANDLTLNQGGNTTFSGTLADGGIAGGTGGGVVKEGAGTLTLAGANTYTGGTQVNAGGLILTGSLTSGSVDIAAGAIFTDAAGGLAANAVVTNAGTLILGANDSIGSFTNTGTFVDNGFTLTAGTYNLNDTSVVSGDLGAGTVNANGIVRIDGSSSATAVNIVTGTTTLGSAERLLDTVDLDISAGAELVLGGAEKIGSLSGAGSLDNHGSRLTVDDGSFSGEIHGSGGLTKTGSGTLAITSAQSYTGSTVISNGTVDLTGSLASDSITIESQGTLQSGNGGLVSNASVNNAGTFDIGGTDQTIGSLVNTGLVSGTATLTAGTYDLQGGSVVDADLGAGILTTSGLVVLNGTSAALTVDVRLGSTLTLGGSELLADNASVTVNGTLNLGGIETIYALYGSGLVNLNSFVLNVTNGGLFTGTLNAGTTSLESTGGTLDLTGSQIITDVVNVKDGGDLNLTEGGSITTNDVQVNGGSTLFIDASSQLTTGTMNIGGTLDVEDPARLDYETLSGTGTIETNGAEFVNNSGSNVQGSLTFSDDFRNEGRLAPGFSPNAINIGGNYTEAGVLEIEVQNTTPVTGHDQVRVGGTVTIDPTAELVVQTFGGTTPVFGNVYQIISNSVGAAVRSNGTFATVTFDVDGLAGSGAAVNNAAVVYDVQTSQLIATGLNGAGSTFADLGADANQRNAAAAIFAAAQIANNQIDSSDAILGTFVRDILTNGRGASANLASFAPAYYGAMADYAFAGNAALGSQLRSRVTTASSAGTGMYAGYTSHAFDTADSVDANRNDFYAGGDYQVAPGVKVGGTFTYNDGDISSSLGKGDVDGFGLSAYGSAVVAKDLTVFGLAGYSSQDFDLKRATQQGSVVGSTDVDSFVLNAGVRYVAYTHQELSIAPHLVLGYETATVDGFQENGAVDALRHSGYDADRITADLGVSAVWETKLAGRAFQLEASLGLKQILSDSQDTMTTTLVGSPGVRYGVGYADDDSSLINLGLNLGYEVTAGSTVYAGYEGLVGGETNNKFNLGYRYGF